MIFSQLSYFLQQGSGKGYRRGERFEQFREIEVANNAIRAGDIYSRRKNNCQKI